MTTDDIVRKLWDLCHVLRDDGITYHQYLTELTFYRATLLHLGTEASGRVQAIFANATTSIKQPRNLHTLVQEIDGLDWFAAREEGLGKMYEDLLERNATEKKSGAGQYFTPRPLIDCMVRLLQPKPGDPAAGTAGFLVAADHYVRQRTDKLFDLGEREQLFQRRKAFYGIELVEDAHRLALMNLMLHDMECDLVRGDTLSPDGARLPPEQVKVRRRFGSRRRGGRLDGRRELDGTSSSRGRRSGRRRRGSPPPASTRSQPRSPGSSRVGPLGGGMTSGFARGFSPAGSASAASMFSH